MMLSKYLFKRWFKKMYCEVKSMQFLWMTVSENEQQ